METLLSRATMRDGGPVAVWRIEAPDEKWAGRILPFLAHKGGIWQWQLEQLLHNKFDGLTFRCYLADTADPTAAGQPNIVANICTIESNDVGIFGHVYTQPAWRGQSIARILTRATMDDFASRGGQAMWLTTDYNTTPYRVYRQFGYESVTPEDGMMAWFGAGGQAELARRFASGQPVAVRPVQWPDYATLNALSCCPAGPPQRSRALRIVGQGIVEFSFLGLMKELGKGGAVRAMVLATETGWPVGWAIVQPDAWHEWSPWHVGSDRPGRPSKLSFLDLYAHPNYASSYGLLLDGLGGIDGKCIAIIDSVDSAREAALRSAGFAIEARLTGMYTWQRQAVDTIFMTKGRA